MRTSEERRKKEAEIKQLFSDPFLHKKYSMDEIYTFMNALSSEIKISQVDRYNNIDFVSVLPPLSYDNKFIKGVCYTQAADLLYKTFPNINELYHVISLSMFCNFAHQENGDALFTLYDNDERYEWFRKNFPHRKHQIFIPLEDADFTHEYVFYKRHIEKEYDIIMVSRISEEKNLPLVAEAFKLYREKYKKDLKVLWVTGQEVGENLEYLKAEQKNIIKEMSKHFDDSYKYIDIVESVKYDQMPLEYSKAKICLLTSLIEGKNRSIREAMSCDTPILAFKNFLQYLRGDKNEIIPNFENNAGYLVPEFSAKSLADGINYMLEKIDTFSARETYLQSHGRKNFFNIILDAFPYYAENIPQYQKGKAFENLWIQLAITDNYQTSLNDFLYSRRPKLLYSRGLEEMQNIVKFQYNKHNIAMV